MIEIIGQEVEFTCVAVNQRYYSEESNFGVFVFHTEDDIPEYNEVPTDPFSGIEENVRMSTLAGNMQQLYIGSEYKVKAVLEYNTKFKSYQYKPISIISVVPKTENQQKQFLMSIITEKQTETLIKIYPTIVQDIIDNKDDVDISKLKGIGEKTYERIKEKILDNYVISDILVMLQPLGVTYNKIKKLVMNEPNPVLLKQKLIDDPYIMLNIKGFGFRTVDQLALKLNPKIRISSKRVYAFITFYLKEVGSNQGHTWINQNILDSAVRDNLNECYDEYLKIIENERVREVILHFNGHMVGLKEYFSDEKMIFEKLQKLNKEQLLEVTDDNIQDGIKQSEEAQGFTLTDEQRKIVIESIKSNVVLITGFAGTGKTSISRAILNIYKNAGYNISCCALSAMAAQRISEATGFYASTIHRLLGFKGGSFAFNQEFPLPSDIILIDECSMINVSIFKSLLQAIKNGAKVIMCGDNRQLPPIGCGNIFGDLLRKTDEFTVFRLTKVLRQAEKSGILMDANKIRNGQYPISQPELKTINGELQDMTYMFRDSRESLQNIAIRTFMKAVEQDGLDNVMIVLPRRANCDNSALEINKKIVKIIADKNSPYLSLGDKDFFVGAKVMQIDNNYEKNVFNGEVGYLTSIREENDGNKKGIKFIVEYSMNGVKKKIEYNRNELEQIDLAYATTCHKVQGGNIKNVIVIIDMTHYTLLDTCMLYTCITRAKKRCLLLAEPNAFKMCMANNKSKNRQTWLKEMC